MGGNVILCLVAIFFAGELVNSEINTFHFFCVASLKCVRSDEILFVHVEKTNMENIYGKVNCGIN